MIVKKTKIGNTLLINILNTFSNLVRRQTNWNFI